MALRGSHGNLLHFSLPSDVLRIVATTTKICTTGGFSSTHVAAFLTLLLAFLLVHTSVDISMYSGGSVARFSAIHFQGYFIRQVSCYTLLSGFRLP